MVDIRPILTENMMFDIYWEMIFGSKTREQIGNILRSDHLRKPQERQMLKILSDELGKLDVFNRYVNR